MLARRFHAAGSDVVVLSRRPGLATWPTVPWDGRTLGPWAAEIDGADVVINLAGRSVNCRYSPQHRREIVDSRVESTRVVGEAIVRAASPPKVWLQAGTATIYAHTYDKPNDEQGVIGGDEPNAPDTWRFSIEVATAWEAAFNAVQIPRTRKVCLRSAMTMSPDRGGVFDVLLGLVRRGLGGAVGDGRQYVSWIHDVDFIHAMEWLIENDMAGSVNICAPGPVPNAEFMRTLRSAWGKRWGLSAARWMVEVGAWAMRTESELVLKSRKVVSGRLLEAGFTFRFPEWDAAAYDLCQRWRNERTHQT